MREEVNEGMNLKELKASLKANLPNIMLAAAMALACTNHILAGFI